MLETVVLAGEAEVLWDAASLAGAGVPVTLWSKDDRPVETEIRGIKKNDCLPYNKNNVAHRIFSFIPVGTRQTL